MNNEIIQSILDSGTVTDKLGNVYSLHSNVGLDKGNFIWQLIRSHEIQHTLEVGCAFGISSLFICDALSNKSCPKHVIIDPHQSSQWYGVGIHNLERAGFRFYELIEKPSEVALPALAEHGDTFDFALIDGMHRFENVLLDFFYVDRILKIQGIIVFDDVRMPPVNKALRYILNYPTYQVVGLEPKTVKYTLKRRLLGSIKKGIKTSTKLIPGRMARELFDDSVFRPNSSLGLDREMIAIQKLAPDARRWDWYKYF